MRNIITLVLIVTSLFLSACSWVPDLSYVGLPRVHKVDIPQGNIVEQDQINQLRPGMTKAQVKFLMGTPMLDDSFHADRWDYLYRFTPGYGDIITKQATLYFNGDGKLVSIQGTFRPGDKAEKVHTTTNIVVVPLEDYIDYDKEDRGFWQSFTDFFTWTEEHEGISSGIDTPVGARGEGEIQSGTIETSPQTQGHH